MAARIPLHLCFPNRFSFALSDNQRDNRRATNGATCNGLPRNRPMVSTMATRLVQPCALVPPNLASVQPVNEVQAELAHCSRSHPAGSKDKHLRGNTVGARPSTEARGTSLRLRCGRLAEDEGRRDRVESRCAPQIEHYGSKEILITAQGVSTWPGQWNFGFSSD
jgi:hypothetical protein